MTATLHHNKYTLWFHSPNETNFESDSFKKVCEITNLNEFNAINKSLLDIDISLTNDLYYLMKDDIMPIWHNDNHINGGCISWKINSSDSIKCWKNLLFLFMSGELKELEKYGITGISINPKKYCNILKIWFKNVIPKDDLRTLPLSKHCIFQEKIKIFKIFKTFLKQ
jgi:hypothetical protein